jgi:hypothetical protein
MKGPLKVDNPITSKVDRFEMWGYYFFVKIIGSIHGWGTTIHSRRV